MRRTKRRYHHGDLPRTLKDLTLELIARRGIQGVTLREVAKAAGVTHGAPYRHFRSREALLAAIAEDSFRMLAADLDQALGASNDPLQRLAGLGAAHVRFALNHPMRYRLMFGAELRKEEHPVLHDEARACFERVVTCVASCQQEGVLRAGEPRDLALVLWASMHGFVDLAISQQLGGAGFESHDVELPVRNKRISRKKTEANTHAIEELAMRMGRLLLEGILHRD